MTPNRNIENLIVIIVISIADHYCIFLLLRTGANYLPSEFRSKVSSFFVSSKLLRFIFTETFFPIAPFPDHCLHLPFHIHSYSTRNCEKVQVGKDQEKAQSEKDSHSKNRGGKKPN